MLAEPGFTVVAVYAAFIFGYITLVMMVSLFTAIKLVCLTEISC